MRTAVEKGSKELICLKSPVLLKRTTIDPPSKQTLDEHTMRAWLLEAKIKFTMSGTEKVRDQCQCLFFFSDANLMALFLVVNHPLKTDFIYSAPCHKETALAAIIWSSGSTCMTCSSIKSLTRRDPRPSNPSFALSFQSPPSRGKVPRLPQCQNTPAGNYHCMMSVGLGGGGKAAASWKPIKPGYLRNVLIRLCPGPQSFPWQSTIASKECTGKTFSTSIPLKNYIICDSVPILRHDLCQSTQAIKADTFHGLWVKCSKKPTKENFTRERNPPEAWLEVHSDLSRWDPPLSSLFPLPNP